MSEVKGLLLIPTLNRIELLKSFIKSYKEADSIVRTLLLVDQADFIANADGYKEIESLLPRTMTILNTGSAVTMGDKIRFVYPNIKSIVEDLRWVGLLNDDHYIITKGWDKIVETLIDGKNFISTNDGYWNVGFQCCGLTAWSIELLEIAGFPIYPDRLQHLYIDNLWKALGESTGSWLETMRINVEHRHVIKGAMQPDQTYVKSNNQDQYKKEEAIFKDFMETQFKDVCLNIIKMRSDQVLDAKFV